MPNHINFGVVRGPGTDFANNFFAYESMKQCRPFYLQFARCHTAVGSSFCLAKCKDEYHDLMECVFGVKNRQRFLDMEAHRRKLWKEGKLKQRYLDPPPPGFIGQAHLLEPW